MKQAFLTAICTLLLLSVALGGVGYSDTVNFLEKTVGGLADNLERVKGILGSNNNRITPSVGSELLDRNNISNIDETVTLKALIIRFARDDGCAIPDIDAIYPKMYECTINDMVGLKKVSYDVNGIRFKYNGNEFYYWDIHGYSTGGQWGGYNTYIGQLPTNNSHVVKVGAGNYHYSAEYDLNDLRLNPMNWRFNFTVHEIDTNVIDYFCVNVD